MNSIIKRLTVNDLTIWKELRLEMLQLHPEAFGSSFEEELKFSDEEFKNGLTKNYIVGAFIDNSLIGAAGFYQHPYEKTRHKGTLYSMYLQQEFRGHGIADALLTAIIDHARGCVKQIHLSVITVNEAASKLYQKHGFTIFGTEPRALKVGDRFYDQYLMVLKLD